MSASLRDLDEPDGDVWEGSRWFHALPVPEPPPELRDRVMAAVAAYERQRCVRRIARRITGAAIATLLVPIIIAQLERRFHRCKGKMLRSRTYNRGQRSLCDSQCLPAMGTYENTTVGNLIS